MPRTIRRYTAWTLMLVALGLVGCGGQNTPRSASESASPSAAASLSAAASPRASSTAAASAAPSTAATTAAVASDQAGSGRYAGIAQSKTAEGYYMLGEPDAPVVLTHYSDFL